MVAVPPRFFLARNVSSGLYLDINKVKEDDGTKVGLSCLKFTVMVITLHISIYIWWVVMA